MMCVLLRILSLFCDCKCGEEADGSAEGSVWDALVTRVAVVEERLEDASTHIDRQIDR